MLEAKQGIDADLADLQPWLAENDVAGVATARTVKLLVAKEIEQSRADEAVFRQHAGQGHPKILWR